MPTPAILAQILVNCARYEFCCKKFGCSLRGIPARAQKLLWRGQRVNALAAMSTSGILDCYTTIGSVTAERFEHFVYQSLVPVLQPFDGINPNSVVILR